MSGLSKWAKIGVLAMIAADAIGILVVHNRLNQPLLNAPSLADDMPVAMAETPLPLPKDAIAGIDSDKDLSSGDNLQVAQMDIQALPAVSRIDPLPAPMAIEPLELDTPQASPRVARAMQAALRAPVIPSVRIAELRPARKTTRTFTTAFANDISTATRSSRRQVPSADFAASSAAMGAVDMSATPDGLSGNAGPAIAENSAMQSQSDVPVPEFGGPSAPEQLELDLPAPAAPEAGAPATGETPAS